LILHNMCVSDRVMGNVYARYDASFEMESYERIERISYPVDLRQLQDATHDNDRSVIGALTLDAATIAELARIDRWRALHNQDEFLRIHQVLSDELNKPKNKKRKFNVE
jgi:hypothetical protein